MGLIQKIITLIEGGAFCGFSDKLHLLSITKKLIGLSLALSESGTALGYIVR